MRPPTIGLLILIAACGQGDTAPGAPDAGAEAADGGAACTSSILCYGSCGAGDPTCLAGTFDPGACACVLADGGVVPMPPASSDPLVLTGLAFAAAPASARLGAVVPLPVKATWSNGVTKDVGGSVAVTVTPADAAEQTERGWRLLKGPSVRFEASFTYDGVTKQAAAEVAVAAQEVRAIWVTRFAYGSAADVRRIIQSAAEARFNVVLFQIRGNGDAFYASTLEPWAQKLTGTLGKDPGWDPLQVAIDEAHARGMELHAYFNVFAGWSADATPPESPAGGVQHVLRAHPDWALPGAFNEYRWFDPEKAELRAHNVAVARELLTKYALDGLHLDRIRHPGASGGMACKGDSPVTVGVNEQVRALYGALRELRPKARLSASVWGIHTPLTGCSTSKGLADYCQDSWEWAKGGYIDALVPMIYWADGTGCTDYGDLLATFAANVGDRQVWGGMHALDKDPGCSGNCKLDLAKLTARIDLNREALVEGAALFASSYMDPQGANDQRSVWKLLADGPYAQPSPVPARSP